MGGYYFCMKELIIIRGLPGSGKSTFAKLLGRAICSADDYLYTREGKYIWTEQRVRRAHGWCEKKCRLFMQRGISPVIIANTAITSNNLRPYKKFAKQYGYRVHSVIVENRHGGKNKHNVPKEKMKAMKEKFNIQL
jgi:predicted kinase